MFENRIQAAQLLAEKLLKQAEELNSEAIVLGIPRGGVIVASQLARILHCSLDIIVVKKIGAPGVPELAIGALGETNGSQYLDQRLLADLNVSNQYLEEQTIELRKEIKRREQVFRQGKPALDLKNKTVIITDDGAATGATVIAASREVWNQEPKKVIIALPVLAKDTLLKLEKEADKVIFLTAPEPFFSVGQFYQEFEQVSDQEVIKALENKQ